MFSALLVATACLTFDAPTANRTEALPSANVAATYEAVKRQVGRSPDDHVRLALWCEAHEMETERQSI